MIFVYSAWDEFCKNLKDKGLVSIPACEVKSSADAYLVLKHDIENNVKRSYRLAEIEKKYGHRGSYYVHAYLLEDTKNVDMLKKMQDMGHEISYHYDVMDSNHGDIDSAIIEFEENKKKFEACGFKLHTVCQHGNPVVERVGYSSNRDFFRNEKVQKIFPELADIMVDFKKKYATDYVYYSDAGRRFNMIFDPINNDIINSDDKNIPYENLNQLIQKINKNSRVIISTHPHRWTESVFEYICKEKVFKIIRRLAKIALKVPFLKRVMNRYYYLAKKI